MQSICLKKTDVYLGEIPKQDIIKKEITELERKVIRYKSACLSCFCRPIDRENLINAQAELYALDNQLALIGQSSEGPESASDQICQTLGQPIA